MTAAVLDQPPVEEEVGYAKLYPMRALAGAILVWNQWIEPAERDMVVSRLARETDISALMDGVLAVIQLAGFAVEVQPEQAEPAIEPSYGLYL